LRINADGEAGKLVRSHQSAAASILILGKIVVSAGMVNFPLMSRDVSLSPKSPTENIAPDYF
jgi:hypothetical protein